MSEDQVSQIADDDEFIKVVEKEDSDIIEFPKEDNNTVLLKTIQTQYPDAIGLKYKGPTGSWRAVKEDEDAFVPPKGGWGDNVYCITLNNKRKANDVVQSVGEAGSKVARPSNPLLGDLAVIGLSYETTSSDLKTYMEATYGPLEACIVNHDRATGKSKGFGFVRFKDEDAAKAALEGEGNLQGRKILVRHKTTKPMKLFVNGLPQGTTQEELVSYFSQFGTITDSHIPKEFKGFAFFTLSNSDDARNVLKQKHELRGNSLKVRKRTQPGEAGADQGPSFGYGAYPPSYPPARGGRGRGGSFGNRGRGRGGSEYGNQGMRPSPDQLKSMLFEFLTN